MIPPEQWKGKSLIHSAMRKYGKDAFIVETIEAVPYDILSERERYWIEKLDSRNKEIGYNLCKGGEGGLGGSVAGRKHSEETRRKMSENRKGCLNSNYGNRWSQSEELRRKHSLISRGEGNGMYGKKQSPESKEKSRLSHLGRKRMSNDSLFPAYKMIKPNEISQYLQDGWYMWKDKIV